MKKELLGSAEIFSWLACGANLSSLLPWKACYCYQDKLVPKEIQVFLSPMHSPIRYGYIPRRLGWSKLPSGNLKFWYWTNVWHIALTPCFLLAVLLRSQVTICPRNGLENGIGQASYSSVEPNVMKCAQDNSWGWNQDVPALDNEKGNHWALLHPVS